MFTARFIDRIGKGIRGAPRDALVADIAPSKVRGASFGLRQSLDTVGAFIGPLLALGLMLLWANDFRAVFWVAVIPGALAVALLVFGVREPEREAAARPINPIRRESLRKLSRAYWWVVTIGAVFTLARFSEAFVPRAAEGGLPLALVPLVMVGKNVTMRSPRIRSAPVGPHSACYGCSARSQTADVVLGYTTSGRGVARRFALGPAHGNHARGSTTWLLMLRPDCANRKPGCLDLVSGVALLIRARWPALLGSAGARRRLWP